MRVQHRDNVERFGRDSWQSVAIRDDSDKVVFAVGVALPGVYDWGYHKNAETIEVLEGYMVVDGKKFIPKDEPLRVPAGGTVVITVEVPTAYKRT